MTRLRATPFWQWGVFINFDFEIRALAAGDGGFNQAIVSSAQNLASVAGRPESRGDVALRTGF